MFFRADAYFVHMPCEEDGDRSKCPEFFWKFRQDCFRPNDESKFGPGASTALDCLYDPAGETCDLVLWLSCGGYTTNMADDCFRYTVMLP